MFERKEKYQQLDEKGVVKITASCCEFSNLLILPRQHRDCHVFYVRENAKISSFLQEFRDKIGPPHWGPEYVMTKIPSLEDRSSAKLHIFTKWHLCLPKHSLK